MFFFFFKQKTAYEMRISDWSSDVCSSDLLDVIREGRHVDLTVALVEAPETPPRDITQLQGNQPLAGATVGNLSPAFAEEIGADTLDRGVIITIGSAACR